MPTPSYPLAYSVQYANAGTAPETIALPVGIVPLHASRVTVLRYGIVPDYPFTLGYRACKASMNLTRAPLGTLTITPHSPIDKVADDGEQTDGNKDPAGRVIFTPPVLVFPPGVMTAEFTVRIDRRIDDLALYYRIDYEIDGTADDVESYLPFKATWHVGAAAAHQLLLVLVLALPLLLAAL